MTKTDTMVLLIFYTMLDRFFTVMILYKCATILMTVGSFSCQLVTDSYTFYLFCMFSDCRVLVMSILTDNYALYFLLLVQHNNIEPNWNPQDHPHCTI